MGEPNLRLNPKVESQIKKILLEQAIKLILFAVMLLPIKINNKTAYDYRKIIGLCILRIFLRKTYSDYEIEMRADIRICKAFQLELLPSKSTIHRGMEHLTMDLLYELNKLIIKEQLKRVLNIIIDASGIRTDERSTWFCLRIKKEVSRRDCDKLHLAVCADLLLILNWRITTWRKNDCPLFKTLLKPFRILGIVFADTGYLSRANFQLCMDKKGCAFIPFKKNSIGGSRGSSAWKFAFNLWKKCKWIYEDIYHQRSKIESVFSVIKRRFGDKVNCKSAIMRRKEIALRLLVYNLRILICYRYASEHNLPLWVRAKKD
jgi:hypothetical protein